MDFKPMSDSEIREMNLLPPGRYHGTVSRADHKNSNTGNDYFNLKIRARNIETNKVGTIFDALLFEGKMFYKLKHFCEATGMMDKYNSGKLYPQDCDGKEFEFDLIHRIDKNGELKNSVKDYIVPKKVEANDGFENQINEIQGF
jgi:hypothetical protein